MPTSPHQGGPKARCRRHREPKPTSAPAFTEAEALFRELTRPNRHPSGSREYERVQPPCPAGTHSPAGKPRASAAVPRRGRDQGGLCSRQEARL